MSLKEFIKSIIEELGDCSINKQRKRYLESYLEELLVYEKNHPHETVIPSSFELYCDINPNALECRIYDD